MSQRRTVEERRARGLAALRKQVQAVLERQCDAKHVRVPLNVALDVLAEPLVKDGSLATYTVQIQSATMDLDATGVHRRDTWSLGYPRRNRLFLVRVELRVLDLLCDYMDRYVFHLTYNMRSEIALMGLIKLFSACGVLSPNLHDVVLLSDDDLEFYVRQLPGRTYRVTIRGQLYNGAVYPTPQRSDPAPVQHPYR